MGLFLSGGQQGAGSKGLPFPRSRWAILGFVTGVLTWSIVGGAPRARNAETTEGPADATGRLVDEGAEPAEEAGGAVGRAVRQVRDGVQDASSVVRGKIADVQDSARRLALESSVKDRLLQDRAIDAGRIEVEAQDSGTVALKGMVPDEDAKELAVDVARGTRGVVRVEDHLAVPPAPRVFNAPAAEGVSASRARRLR